MADRTLDALEAMVRQHCNTTEEDVFDSWALSANAEAMEALAEAGRFVIDKEAGGRVVGRFVECEPMTITVQLEPGRWWRVDDKDGNLWSESSSLREAMLTMRDGDVLLREWRGSASVWRLATE